MLNNVYGSRQQTQYKEDGKSTKGCFRALLLELFKYKIAQWEVRFKSHQDHSYNIKTFFLFIAIVENGTL